MYDTVHTYLCDIWTGRRGADDATPLYAPGAAAGKRSGRMTLRYNVQLQHSGDGIHAESITISIGRPGHLQDRLLVGRGVYRIDYWSAGAFAGYDDLRRGKGSGSTAQNADIKVQKN